MEAEKGKPYMIQLFDANKIELGKYKFVIAATQVSNLRNKIQEKLVSKKQLKPDQHIVLKDSDDFQLGSDDEVGDVVINNKVKAYIIQQNQQSNPTITNQAPVTQNVLPQQPAKDSNKIIQPPQNIAAIDSPIINQAGLTLPEQLAENHPEQKKFTLYFPQIRKSPFVLDASDFSFLSFYEFSVIITKKFNIDPSIKALLYSQQGQPLLFNVDLMHKKMPKIDFSRKHYVIFTATKTLSDQIPVQPQGEITNNQVQLKVSFNAQTFNIKTSLDNYLSIFKYKVFKETGIHPANQIIKFANNPLLNDAETLSTFGIKGDSILELHFKIISNIVPASYSDKFFYKDIQHLNAQDQDSLRNLRSNLLVFGQHLSELDQKKILYFLRYYTNNQTLVCAFRVLFYKGFLSQAHRIALEEGIYIALWHYLSACQPKPTVQAKNIFSNTRNLFGYILQATESMKITQQMLNKSQQTILLQNQCSLTTKPIKMPALIKLDDGSKVIVDRNQMMQQIDKGYTFPLLKKPIKTQLFDNYTLLQNFDILKFNSNQTKDSNIIVVLWLGLGQKSIQIPLPAVCEADKYEINIASKNSILKIHQPLQAKNRIQNYFILRNKEKQLRIFISKNKDINKPHNIFDVISGKQESVSLDLMVGAGKTQNLQEQIDIKDLKPVITRQPKEAIVVLFDISGSMGSRFFNQPDLKRIGACKLFFEALAYRTIAYNFQHVVSLTFFDYSIDTQCDFTESIYDFNRLISNANPRGSTKLYDSIINASNQLLQFKKKYPQCILRIMALTDGEDTASSSTIFDAAKAVVTNDIIMDSFAVGASCDGLKSITLATGGKCYLTRNLEQTLKLFEQETVLSVRSRKIQERVIGKSDQQIKQHLQKAKVRGFDLPNNVHEFKMPEIKGPGLSSQDIAKKYESQEGQKKLSGNSSLKRIAKQIQMYNSNPHPFVAIFPCQNICVWKILLLGPKQTPYQNGLFLLYANFPGDYPFRAPQVRFITPIYHCNMNQQGRICHSVFDRNYSPALTFRHIIDCIYGLILTPETDDPLDNVIASYFLSQYQKYYKNAQQATAKNASKSSIQLVQEIFGKITDDIQKQKRIQEVEKWIQKAKTFN